MKQNTLPEKIKVVITGGGTGGHIYPAIAVAQRLMVDDQVKKVYYIGCSKNMEKDIVEGEGLEFFSVDISGMPRKNIFGIVSWLIELHKAVGQAIGHLRKIKPDVIFGTGGYVSGPALLAATILRIPFVIHDCDAKPGIVTRFMSYWAKAVSVSFEEARSILKQKKAVVNGNPIRAAFGHISREEAVKELGLDPDKKTILVMGGSQGAKTINETMLEAAPILIKQHDFQIIHQTGRKNYDEYMQRFVDEWPEFLPCKEYLVKSYFDNMQIPLAVADLAVSRAGSLSISELNLSGLPSILIPFPYAAANHQMHNAKALEKAGAAVCLEDSKCNVENLVSLILKISKDDKMLSDMRKVNKLLAKPDATGNLVNIIKKAAVSI